MHLVDALYSTDREQKKDSLVISIFNRKSLFNAKGLPADLQLSWYDLDSRKF